MPARSPVLSDDLFRGTRGTRDGLIVRVIGTQNSSVSLERVMPFGASHERAPKVRKQASPGQRPGCHVEMK